MSRRDATRIDDILLALDAIERHLKRGTLADDLIFDAIRIRFIEIGEAVKSIDPSLLRTEPEIPWSEVAKLRDKLTHHYFDASHQIMAETIASDVPKLDLAVRRLAMRATSERS